MRTFALFAVVTHLPVAGCGGSHQSQEAGIDAALRQSPNSYLHYQAPIWWGTRPNIHRTSLALDGKYALAGISAPTTHPGERKQWVLLARSDQGWRVVGDILGRAAALRCTDATKQTLERMAGGCTHDSADWPGGAIVGPREERAPTSSEVASLTRVARRVVFRGHDSCVTYVIGISKVDQRFARVAYEFHKPYGNCRVGNGESLFKRTASGWVHLGDASEPFPCAYAPAGVVRSLLGECWLFAR